SHAGLTTESKGTVPGQATIPAPVRGALKLKPGQDSIHYEILPCGQVFMCRLGDEQED
ncbi:type II toxin-antitoxin system PrlF family antitoxin, partial [Escherichia coli]|uniref:type II toxin-antitoxin system PrlF family antitoxin n=1 Tax=Escherichia coli TaxID=562 RepID=UPI001484D654